MQINMVNLTQILILAIYCSNTRGFEIDKHSPDQVLNEGQNIALFCQIGGFAVDPAYHDWKKCRWSRDSDGATCLYTYKKTDNGWVDEEFCDPLLEDSEFFGSDDLNKENRICGINVPSADQLDNGNWTCKIEQCQLVIHGGCGATAGNENIVEATVNVKVNI